MKMIRNNLLKITGLLALMTVALSLAQDGAMSINLGDSADHGQFLTDANGMALYIFAPDAQGASTCTGDCATNWPPVTVASADALPTVAEGLDAALLGTVERDDGTLQLTYNGWPLYYFGGDTEAGQTNGQAVGDNWYLIDAMGEVIGMEAAQ